MILDLLGGFAFLYALICLVPPAIAKATGAPFPLALFVWMLLTGWNPYGWLAAALFIWLTRQPAH
jgi:hypothetical protein